MIDEIYDKYCHIIYKWSETVKVNVTVRVYAERKAENSDDMYYVYGIGDYIIKVGQEIVVKGKGYGANGYIVSIER